MSHELMSLVSIIIPCYNQSQYLSDALKSVQDQTYANWECIIINDGSSDSTYEISQKFIDQDSRITYLYQDNQGVSSARNTAIQNSHGHYILPLDADDLISAHYIEEAVSILQEKPDIKIVYCDGRYFGKRNCKISSKSFSIKNILIRNMIFCTALFRRQDYDLAGGYKASMIYGWEDWDLWLSILEQGGTAYKIPKTYFSYRIKSESRSTGIEKEKRKYLSKQIYWNHYDFYCEVLGNPVDILDSREFAVGKFLLYPFRYLQKLFHQK